MKVNAYCGTTIQVTLKQLNTFVITLKLSVF